MFGAVILGHPGIDLIPADLLVLDGEIGIVNQHVVQAVCRIDECESEIILIDAVQFQRLGYAVAPPGSGRKGNDYRFILFLLELVLDIVHDQDGFGSALPDDGQMHVLLYDAVTNLDGQPELVLDYLVEYRILSGEIDGASCWKSP